MSMVIKFIHTLIILIVATLFVYGAEWIPDLGNGRYKNPIIFSDYSDPDIVRVEDDFYMVVSSFNCMPGIPVLHSKDLVN
jgi:beta-xylosidase